MFYLSNKLFIFVSTVVFFVAVVKITSYLLNPNLVLILYGPVSLQSKITFVANSLRIKIMVDFFGSSISSCARFSVTCQFFMI